MIRAIRKLSMVALFAVAANAQAQLRIGVVDPGLPKEPGRHNAAALAFAATAGTPCRLRPTDAGAWQDARGRFHAAEEFDVIWYHQGDDPSAALGEAAGKDLLSYLEGGGTLLLSGAAGRLLNDLAIESSVLRLVGPTNVAFLSGVRVNEKHRSHPIFAGFDATQPILLTTVGGTAFGDFYQSGAPHGQLLAEGNAGQGERPLVEYTVGAGRVIFIGWRLPDFTTSADPYRKNLERLFRNMLGYLAKENSNRASLITPPGESRYVRVRGVPMLRGAALCPRISARGRPAVHRRAHASVGCRLFSCRWRLSARISAGPEGAGWQSVSCSRPWPLRFRCESGPSRTTSLCGRPNKRLPTSTTRVSWPDCES